MKSLYLSLLAGLSFIFTGCFSFSNFQTGRTIGKNKTELGLSINYMGYTESNLQGSVGLPVVEFAGKYGISENVDIGIRLANFGFINADVKYQFWGDKESPFAMATGFGAGGTFIGFNVGSTTEGLGFYQLEVPLHMSYHPVKNFAVYLSPRYIGFGAFAGGVGGYVNSLVFSPGIEFGNRVKIGVNYNLVLPIQDFTFAEGWINTFGIGFKTTF
jgi:hypothetical protein